MQRVLVTGSTGFIGQAVMAALAARGDQPVPLRRTESPMPGRPSWRPETKHIDLRPAGRIDAVIHLAGENIGRLRWTNRLKDRFWSSRVDATTLLVGALRQLPEPPKVIVAASASGFYGSRGSERLAEASPPGTGFLAELCQAWETQSMAASTADTRVVIARIGLVLDSSGGTLQRLLPVFRMGLGGRLGNGRQMVSWITREDLVRGLLFALETPSLAGPINMAAPESITNAEFARALARRVRRWAILPTPAWLLRLALGEVADHLLLASTHMVPERLARAGFVWLCPDVSGALDRLLPRQ